MLVGFSHFQFRRKSRNISLASCPAKHLTSRTPRLLVLNESVPLPTQVRNKILQTAQAVMDMAQSTTLQIRHGFFTEDLQVCLLLLR